MSQSTGFFIITLVAIYFLYLYFERRLSRIERRSFNKQDIDDSLNQISEKLDSVKEMCSPLWLLNIFDDVGLNGIISDFEEAAYDVTNKVRIMIANENEEEEKFEKEHPDAKDFEPSLSLKSDIFAASVAIVVRQTIETELQILQGVYWDVVHGKLSITDARIKAEEVDSIHNYYALRDYYYHISLSVKDIEEGSEIHPEIKKEYLEFLSGREKFWKNGRWKESLKRRRETGY